MSEFDGHGVYENVNMKIADLYSGERSVLDIGCGTGAMGAYIKGIMPGCVVHGVDISPDACEIAARRLDGVWCVDLDREPLPVTEIRYELVILGDLLEHLKRPDHFLADLHTRLAPGGRVILSVPNIANYSIRLRLLAGEFRYTETGIMDKTHLRFFTMKTITGLFSECGFEETDRRLISRFPDCLSRLMPGLLAVQFIFKLQRTEGTGKGTTAAP
jgi:2-polyprenyl-3-methyl-5-hydroxy-6-metoxy-1,4-benzoquinol methylase